MTRPAGASRKQLLAGILFLNLAGACLLYTLRDHILTHDFRQGSGVVVRMTEQDTGAPTGGTCLVVDYEYSVGGVHFASSRYVSSNNCAPRPSAKRANYGPGSPVTIWYDADDPSFAVMDPIYPWDAAWIWCLFVVMIALGNAELIGQVRRAGTVLKGDNRLAVERD